MLVVFYLIVTFIRYRYSKLSILLRSTIRCVCRCIQTLDSVNSCIFSAHHSWRQTKFLQTNVGFFAAFQRILYTMTVSPNVYACTWAANYKSVRTSVVVSYILALHESLWYKRATLQFVKESQTSMILDFLLSKILEKDEVVSEHCMWCLLHEQQVLKHTLCVLTSDIDFQPP